MCACLLRHPKKSNVFRKIRVTPLRYVFTANDNHSKKRFFFGVAKSSPTSVLQLRFFFVLQSSLKSDFIWSLLLVCRVGKKCFTKMKKKTLSLIFQVFIQQYGWIFNSYLIRFTHIWSICWSETVKRNEISVNGNEISVNGNIFLSYFLCLQTCQSLFWT